MSILTYPRLGNIVQLKYLPSPTWLDQIETQWRIHCSPDTQLWLYLH